jgi:hypothetical protein
LGWQARISFQDLVREMVENDCEALGVGDALKASAVPAKSAQA